MSVIYRPTYCTATSCYYSNKAINPKYKGKFYRKECAYCWSNKNGVTRIRKDKTIHIMKNNTNCSCPVCHKGSSQGEYVIDLGIKSKTIIVHINCLEKFISNLKDFNDNKLPTLIKKLVANSL
jgi:hypothetical protein